MNDTIKAPVESTPTPKEETPVSLSYLLHSAMCKISAIRSIDPDEMKQGDFYGVRYVLDDALKELQIIEDRM